MNNIKSLRQFKGWTIHELARRSFLTPSYISNLEKGKRSNPSMDAMSKIAEALGKTVHEVFFSEN